MYTQLYTIFFILSVAMMVYLVVEYKDRITIYYFLLFASVSVTLLGYMQIASAVNIRQAIVSNQTNYFGACFSPMFLLLSIADLCKVKVKKIYATLLLILAFVIFTLISTYGQHGLYYKNVKLRSAGYGQCSYLVKENGPLHVLMPAYLFIVVIGGIAIILIAVLKKKSASYITSMGTLGIMFIMVTVYVLQKSVKTNFDALPVAYVVSELGILLLLKRVKLYDIKEIVMNSMHLNREYGFLIFDDASKYLGADEVAMEWFPELGQLSIDGAVDNEFTDFLQLIGSYIRGMEKEKVKIYECEDLTVAIKHVVSQEKKVKLHCFYIRKLEKEPSADMV